MAKYKSAVNGQFVKETFAKKHPNTTYKLGTPPKPAPSKKK